MMQRIRQWLWLRSVARAVADAEAEGARAEALGREAAAVAERYAPSRYDRPLPARGRDGFGV